ncbi:hypothetical protein ANO11243_068710 [Dothideomycetidae sp. 11243]|nr:hypothetical protein ANO11243_068710 [fungal sp. No.11243]
MSVKLRAAPPDGPLLQLERQRQRQRAFRALFSPHQHQQPWLRREAAWTVATRWLSFSSRTEIPPPDLDGALNVLLSQNILADRIFQLDEWFAEEIKQHFHSFVAPELMAFWNQSRINHAAHDILDRTAHLLKTSLADTLKPIKGWLTANSKPIEPRTPNFERFRAVVSLHNVGTRSFQLAARRFVSHDQNVTSLALILSTILKEMTSGTRTAAQVADQLYLVNDLAEVGLTSDRGEIALALAVQATIEDHVNGFSMKVDWITGQTRAPDLRVWIEARLQPSALECLRAVTGNTQLQLRASDCEGWQRHALQHLGRSRLVHLLTYVQLWPRSIGAILDLKDYVALIDAKQHLAQVFMSQMEERIGHSGITTAELLTIYVSVIRVFKTLDNRSVLLEKVAQPLRILLRDRQDTVKVIAASFLTEVQEVNGVLTPVLADGEACCLEIAREVSRSEHTAPPHNQSLDWNDMEWLPDPIDAGPDYRTTRTNDIISYMLALFDKDTFILEIQKILGERLLRAEDTDFENEKRLVEMLKTRLGADKLQAAEVMVKDMSDSARIMKLLRSAKAKIPKAADVYDAIPERSAGGAGHPEIQFEAKVLSSFFWPELRDDNFKVPPAIEAAQKEYEKGFKHIKNLRRLQWLNALGRTTVELQLSDRSVMFESIKTWVASVIWAFEGGSTKNEMMDVDGEARGARRSVAELEEHLNMDEVLVRNALSFWVTKRVVREVETDVFEVMETLPKEGESTAAVAAPLQPDDAVSSLKSQDAVLKDNKGMYEMFIIGMLTNGGAMDASRMAMMLKMVVPGGFNFGEDEVTWLLQGMESEGKVEKKGDMWAIKK